MASSKDETLAMSNIAYRFMNAGFVKEANDELQKAIKVENFHRNVGEAIATLKDMPEEEKKSVDEILKKTEPKRNFFKQLGEAITFPDIDSLPEIWTGPDCDLAIGVEKGRLFAVGQFERTSSSALSTLLSGEKKTTLHKLTYKGDVRGRRVLGTLTKKNEGAQPSGGLLGIGDGAEIEFAMVISRDKATISVVEEPSSGSPRFYTLRPKVSAPVSTEM
jgi:hypothetical protein